MAGEATSSAAREWLALATTPSVVRRALTYAVVVGSILVAINHSDAILRGEVGNDRLLRMGLTFMVPYIVSTASSVGALRRNHAPPSASDPGGE